MATAIANLEERKKFPIRKLLFSIGLALAILAAFAAVLVLVELRYYNSETERDRTVKTQGIRDTMARIDREAGEIGQWFQKDLEATVNLTIAGLQKWMENGEYTGPRVLTDGFVARFHEGTLDIPAEIRARFPDLTATQIRDVYHQQQLIDVTGEEGDRIMLLTSGEIGSGWYYVDITHYLDYSEYIGLQLDKDNLLSTLSKTYGGEIFIISGADEGTEIMFSSSGFENIATLEDIGLTREDLSRETLNFQLDGTEYYAFPVHLGKTGLIAVYCEAVSDRQAMVVNRVLLLMAAAAGLLAVLITYGISVIYILRGNRISEEEKLLRYNPRRLRSYCRALGFLATVLIFLVAFFSRSLQYTYHETVKRRGTLDMLNTQLAMTQKRRAEVADMETEWYDFYGERIAELITSRPELMTREGLAELNGYIDAEYLMVFDQFGREAVCSTDYIGFELGTEEDDPTTDFRRILKGVDCIIHEPAPDPVTGHENYQIGRRMTLPGAGGAFGVLLMSVKPETILHAQLSGMEERLFDQMSLSGDVMMKIDPETGEIQDASRPELTGENAVSLGIAKGDIRPENMTFFTMDENWYFGVTGKQKDSIYLYASNGVQMVWTAATYSLIACLIFAAGYILLYLFLLEKIAGRKADPAAAEAISDKDVAVMEAKVLSGRIGESLEKMYGKGKLTSLWEELLYPEKKARMVFLFSVGLLMLNLLISAAGNNVLSRNAVLSFIFSDEWPRGVNLFSFTAIIMIVCIGMLAYMLLRVIYRILTKVLDNRGDTIARLVCNLMEYVIAAVMIYFSLSYLGVDPTTLLASMGIVSLAVSLGAQSLIGDVLAGLSILFEGEFRVGDIVEISGIRGTVIEIGVRSTKLLDEKSHIHIINNQSIRNVVNQSRLNSWYGMSVDLPPTQDPDAVEELMLRELPEIGKQIPEIITGPLYKGISAFHTWGITITVYVEYQEKNFYKVQRKLNKAIVKLLRKEKIAFTAVYPDDGAGSGSGGFRQTNTPPNA